MEYFKHLGHLKRRFSRIRLRRNQSRSGTRGMTIVCQHFLLALLLSEGNTFPNDKPLLMEF